MTELYKKLNELATGALDWDYFCTVEGERVIHIFTDRHMEELVYDTNGELVEKIDYEI